MSAPNLYDKSPSESDEKKGNEPIQNPSPSFSTRQDQWDHRYIGDLMVLHGNIVTFTGGIGDANGYKTQKPNTAFLCSIVYQGVHRWKFKVKLRFCHHWSATIGIYQCSIGDALPRNGIFTLGLHRGYGINPTQGTLVDIRTGMVPVTSPVEYGKRCIGTHVVEMVLDFDNLELKFVIDGENHGTAFAVEKGAYRAAVNLSQIGDFVELL